MSKDPNVILPISLPNSLQVAVKTKAKKLHGERGVSRYTRELYRKDLKKK